MTPIFKAEIKIGSIYHPYEHVYTWTIVKEKKQKQRNVQEEGIYVTNNIIFKKKFNLLLKKNLKIKFNAFFRFLEANPVSTQPPTL